jgi:hypothetical protein
MCLLLILLPYNITVEDCVCVCVCVVCVRVCVRFQAILLLSFLAGMKGVNPAYYMSKQSKHEYVNS